MGTEQEESQGQENIQTRIWREEAETDNPFLARTCYCSGYDVYGELLHKASWAEYLYLLFKLERPAEWQASLLERLMIALANPGPREYSVQAAMTAAAGGSTAASSLMAALAVGAGQVGGAREVYEAMVAWNDLGMDLEKWGHCLANPQSQEIVQVWPEREYPPGFEPYAHTCSTPVQQTLDCFRNIYSEEALGWLHKHRHLLETAAKRSLAMTGIVAAALIDLKFTPSEGEMICLLLRLPGAAAHALEQHMQWRKYPFFKDGLALIDG
jgi:citrate synthase